MPSAMMELKNSRCTLVPTNNDHVEVKVAVGLLDVANTRLGSLIESIKRFCLLSTSENVTKDNCHFFVLCHAPSSLAKSKTK